ncbi:J domain-containing protein [Sphingomonas sp. SUN039]|uniref:J domain-containing protein n=1 Tax=Sphingomonas sp. SUN039 TaxID=2937787 RepID=UPI0021641202|nr:J domain-containing protein [Sphingomonas sp. SUN039]UVO55423.1 J domain-containing protein [Sphingomonas sp. SUN039]
MIKLLFFVALIAVVGWLAVRAMQPAAMPRDEAAKLLGLDASAGTDAVLDAHRRLIAKVHPDAGGSAELAARINQARDIMLKP